MINPVLPRVLEIVREHSKGISEYRLMKMLEREHLFDAVARNGEGLLSLYRKHFLIMNALYDLQAVLWQEEERILEISAFNIVLHQRQSGQLVMREPRWRPQLSDYYLDWDFFCNTTQDDIDRMLQGLHATQAPQDRLNC